MKNTAGIKHGESKPKSPEYITWAGMRQRCLNKNHSAYRLYGKIGVKICPRWNSFENFLEDMGRRPEGFSLDRISGSKTYSKATCRWANQNQQVRSSGPRKGSFKGVYFDKFTKRWRSTIKINGKNKAIGRFDSDVEAARAYDNEAVLAWGSDAFRNFK